MTDFDGEAFCSWLDEQDGSIPAKTLADEWPQFPRHLLKGCTGPIIEGELHYYQCDLHDAARGWRPLD